MVIQQYIIFTLMIVCPVILYFTYKSELSIDVEALLVTIFGFTFFMASTMSFVTKIEDIKYTINPNITEVSDKFIVVDTDKYEFILRELHQRSILTAKAIHVQTYKNCWGIPLEKTTLSWEK